MAQHQKVKPIRPIPLLDEAALTESEKALSEQFPTTEIGLALYIHRLLQGDWCYVGEYQNWLQWSGKVWQTVNKERLAGRIRKLIRALAHEAADTADDTERVNRLKMVGRFSTEQTITHVEKLLRGLCIVDAAQLDSNPLLLVVQNGTIDLQQARQAKSVWDIRLYPHRKEDFCTKLCKASFNPDAPCPAWLAHMHFTTQGDAAYIAHKQRFYGACLSGEVAQVFIVAYGSGGNGKSVESNAFAAMLGEYAHQLPAQALMRDNRAGADASPDKLIFKGARIVFAREADEGSQLADAKVKELTGDDPIVARGLHQDFVTFLPTHKLILYTNHKPTVRDTSNGMWRRMLAWPYTAQAVEKGAACEAGDVVKDSSIKERLLAECDGILTWALDGYLAYAEQGVGTCLAVQVATAGYRSAQDILGLFLADGYVLDPNGVAFAGALYEDYKAWCAENGMRAATQPRLSERLQEKGFTKERKGKGGVWAWVGLRKASAADAQPKEAAAPAQPTASAADTSSAALLDDLTGGA